MTAPVVGAPAPVTEPMIEPGEHPMVLGAMARLAAQGGWARMLAGKPLEDEVDLGDAELLLAARVLRRLPDDRLEPVDCHPWYSDPDALAGGLQSSLRQALRHAEGRPVGSSADDLDLAVAQGRCSASAATVVAESLLPMMPAAHAAFRAGAARFLDVGVGTGAVAGRVCELHPGTRAVGLDVEPAVLGMAREQLAAAGLADRVELRLQSVADLADEEAFDLAWLPQAFIPRRDLARGLRAVRRALRPDRWVVAPVTAAARGTDAFRRAVQVHGARLTGGGPISVEEASGLMTGAGLVDVSAHELGEQVVMLGRRP